MSQFETYELADWVPPWLDNGERLHQMIDVLIAMDSKATWEVIMALLVQQLIEDFKIAKEINDELGL